MSIKNYKAAAALAIFCTLLWGTAFPFIKVGYAQFGIEGNDIGSKLLCRCKVYPCRNNGAFHFFSQEQALA